MSHKMKKCKSCKAIIDQCRCMSEDKKVEWDICKSCLDKMKKEKLDQELKDLECFNSPS